MKKFFIIFLFLSSLNADFLYNNNCLNDFFYKDSILNYQLSSTLQWYQDSSLNVDIQDGFFYDSNSTECNLYPIPLQLGVTYNQFNFLLGIVGLIFGFFLVLSFFIYPLRNM